MKVMENDSSIARRPKGFRKLRWRNYLHHLLNLWLYCGNFSVNGLSNGNSLHKNHSTASFAASLGNRIESRVNSTVDCASCYSQSNKSSSNEMLFHLIKPDPVGHDSLEKSINHAISLDHSSGGIASPSRELGMPENEVNTRNRIINDTVKASRRVKEWKISAGIGSESELSIHYNQSSLPLRNQKKKSKSVKRKPVGSNSTSKSVSKLSKVSLLGLFELTNHLGKVRWEGRSEIAAAELAVKHINERGLLPGYILELITNDTQVTNEKRSE